MDCKTYLDILTERYERYFNIHKDYTLLGEKLDIFAEYNVRSEKYFMVKSAVIYSFENFEYNLVKCYDHEVGMDEFSKFTDLIKKAVKEIVKPNEEHMSTYLSGIMVSEKGFSQEVTEKAQRFKYSKDFLFTLKGWCDARLILVDLGKNEIITNKKGREVRKNYIINP